MDYYTNISKRIHSGIKNEYTLVIIQSVIGIRLLYRNCCFVYMLYLLMLIRKE
ncbi:MAG: hypothetical protein H6Q12_847 [Bacteroidetes bacterium]|nr:hypothetical protein [Bacteroidota bacterium]